MEDKDGMSLHGHTLASALQLTTEEQHEYIAALLDDNARLFSLETLAEQDGRKVQLNLARLQQLYKVHARSQASNKA